MNEAEYITKFKTVLYNCKHNNVHLAKHRQFEIMYALLWNHLLWEDLPPDFGDTYSLPHTRDYGIDTISRTNDQTGQVKHYGSSSRIKWSDFTNFTSYSKDLLDINDMYLGTTRDAKIDSMVEASCKKNNISIHRYTFEELHDLVLQDFEPTIELHHQSTIIEPRQYLLDAYEMVSTTDKAVLKLQLPCGTGKSYIMFYTMLEYLKQDASHTFCVFCPWVDLAKQLRDLFQTQLNVLFIGDGKQGQTNADESVQVVVCVTPSVAHVPNQQYTLKFYDEAHHLEDKDKTYRQQLDAIPSTKTLMFSATFHEHDNLDFDYSLRQAIDDGHIADYVLHLEYFTSGNRMKSLCQMVVEHAEWFPMFVYFNSTEACMQFHTELVANNVKSDYLVGTDNATKRKTIRYQLEHNRLSVLCLCGCYNEGISIDAIQTVVFGELRHSSINKIQISMRANRKHHSKPHYRVVLPITQDDLEGKDMRELVQSFARVDPKVQDVFRNRKMESSRVQVFVGRDGESIADEEEVDAGFLYEEIYDRCGEMVKGRTFEEWRGVLFDYCDVFREVPSQKTKHQNTNIGQWLQDQKKKINATTDNTYQKLAIHPLVKECLDDYLNPERLWLKTRDILFDYCNTHSQVPHANTKYKNTNIGTWLHNQKTKINATTDNTYQKLAIHPIVKDCLDDYLNPERLWLKTRDILFDYCNTHSQVPSQKTKHQNTNIGQWLQDQKKKINATTDDNYQKLATNGIVKAELDRYLTDKDKNKDKPKLTFDESMDILFDYCNHNGKVPSQKTKHQNTNIGQWLQDQKKKINATTDNTYQKLAIHPLVKECLDDYLNPERLWLKTRDILFDYCNTHSQVPHANTKYKNTNIGTWLHNQKTKINATTDNTYQKLAIHPLVKECLDDYLNPERLWLKTRDILFDYCNTHSQVPSKKTKHKNTNIGQWLQSQKTKITATTDNTYQKLAINPLVKECLDEYLHKKEKNKDNIKLTFEQWRDILFDYCNTHSQVPHANTKYKNTNIGTWLHNQKTKINATTDNTYQKLAIHPIVKTELDRYLVNKEKNKTVTRKN
jgi:phage tail tube protein FII